MLARYWVVEADNRDELSVMIHQMIREGWELQGGVSVALSESDEYRYILYAQAMIKRDTPKEIEA